MDKREQRVLTGFLRIPLSRPVLLLFAVLLLLRGAPLYAADAEPLVHMGVLCLNEEPLAAQFAKRLIAEGKPVFFITDIIKGVSQGDIIRFRDKVVLIDGEVWQTMMSMGILNRLKDIPILSLSARAKSDVWNARSDQVSSTNENKGYTLGRELLKIFEDYFGKTPSEMELVIKFNNDYMTLVAPRQLMSELKFVNVVREQKVKDKPFFITPPFSERQFISQEYSFSVWAVDLVEPSGQLRYTCSSELPPGLFWDSPKHTIRGTLSSTGTWPLSFSVRNSGGLTATFNCTLTVINNTPPRIGVQIDDAVIAGSNWEHDPFIADAEHTLDQIDVRLFRAPPGMSIDPKSKRLSWLVPNDIRDSAIHFVIGASDPLGASTKESVSFRVVAPGKTQAITIDFRLPLDTIIQGHTYRWPDRVWMKAEWHDHSVQLKSITGDHETTYRHDPEMEEGELTIRPMKSGSHSLVFSFILDTLEISIRKSMVVLPNRKPEFRSRMSCYEFQLNQNAQYVPVVFDVDNDSLNVNATDASGNSVSLVGGALRLETDKAGFYPFLIRASDPFGNVAEQRIYYTVKAPAVKPVTFYVQKAFRLSGDLGVEVGGLRIGLYTTDVVKTSTTGIVGINTYESPYIFFGANLLSERQAAMGNYLYIDAGINFRAYNERVYGGGVMARFQTSYRRSETSPWRFGAFLDAHLKQAILIADTNGIGAELKSQFEDVNVNDVMKESNIVSYMDKMNGIFNSYGKHDNVGIHFRMQTLYRLPFYFWLGPSVWLEDEIKPPVFGTRSSRDSSKVHINNDRGNIVKWFTGICLLHEFNYKRVGSFQQIHLGWPGNSFVPRVHYNFALKLKAVKRNRIRT